MITLATEERGFRIRLARHTHCRCLVQPNGRFKSSVPCALGLFVLAVTFRLFGFFHTFGEACSCVGERCHFQNYLGSGALLVKYEFGFVGVSEAPEIRPDAGHAA
jgi:hypothetical protein